MAEILIQRRHHRSVWPWLLGLLALALLPLLFLAGERDGARPRRTAAAPVRDTTARHDTAGQGDPLAAGAVAARRDGPVRGNPRTTASAAGAVAPDAGAETVSAPRATAPNNEFQRFIAAPGRNLDERRQRDYTADGLRRLATELHVLGASDAGVRTMRANADSLQSTGAPSRAHPDQTRAAFLAAVHEFDVLGARRGRAAVDTARLRAAAWAIRPDQRLAAQDTRVQSFFEAAGDALQSLSRFGRRGRAR